MAEPKDQISLPGDPERLSVRHGGPRRILRIFYWLAVAGVWFLIGLFGLFLYYAHDLPDITNPPPPGGSPSVEIRASDGALLATYGSVYGDWLDYRDVPRILIQALVAVEDRRFFKHGGVDFRALLRASFSNLKAGGVRQGGSTLTQQLAKNLFLTPDRTLKRKVQELLVALWLEQKFTKEQILTIYLNRVYFGSGTYGLDAASRKYFGHSARNLSVAEAALLAGLVQAPSLYSPARSPESAYKRAGQVLDSMVRQTVLTEEAADRVKGTPASIAASAAGTNVRYFTDWVFEEAAGLMPVSKEPVAIYTTLEQHMQQTAEAALLKAIDGPGVAANIDQGALLAMAPDGSIRALVGGRSYAKSQYNRAVQAKRQPGSAFKLFVYLAAFENGLAPKTIMEDSPVTVDGWRPENYSGTYAGAVSLETAFARSLNTVAVKVSERTGRGRVAEAAHRLGIAGSITPHPSVALGVSEVSLMELTAAYAAIANGGYRVKPYAILEIQTAEGEILYRRTPEPLAQVIDPVRVEELAGMMAQTIETGTGRGAKIDRPAAGKTGTSQDFRDAWFLGFSGDLVAGVWFGNDDGSPMKGVTGGGLPARTWADFMIPAHIGMPPKPLLSASVMTAREEAEKEEKPGFWDRLFGRKK